MDRDGRPYVVAFRGSGVSTEPEAVEAVAIGLGRYVADASLVVPRHLALPSWPVDVLPAVLSAAILGLGLWRGAGRRREMAGWAALSALTFGLVAASSHSRWPHHFAFPLLLLVLALATALDGLRPRARLAVATLAVVFWATLAVRLPAGSSPADSSPEKDQLLALVRARGLDRESLQLHTSWGTYYIAQLFGDPLRLLVYMRGAPDDPRRLEELRALARACGRKVLLISSSPLGAGPDPRGRGDARSAAAHVAAGDLVGGGVRPEGSRIHFGVAVPPTVISETRIVGRPTPTGTLWPAFWQVPTPSSSRRS